MNEKPLTLGNLFDDFPLAAEMCGINPVWASEIDQFCVAVTSKRFPKMKHFSPKYGQAIRSEAAFLP